MDKIQIITNKGIKIGENANTLLNLLIGANVKESVLQEIEKIESVNVEEYHVDIITDLSLYAYQKNERLWEYVLENTPVMAGTVPIYLSVDSDGNIDQSKLLENIFEQCEKGVSIITIHPTANRKIIELSKSRLIPCTSRGGGIVVSDLLHNNREQNVYLDNLDQIAEMCRRHNVVISIGSTFRSGSIVDALDEAYSEELREQVRIANYLQKLGVNVIIETPGHIDPRKLLELCKILQDVRYPIMPLGPMVTDIGLKEDDTVAAIGASLMGMCSCADVLSIVTSREHLAGIPSLEDIRKAISKYRIIKHIIDLYKIGDMSSDLEISQMRVHNKSCNALSKNECKRCGNVCPLRGAIDVE